MMNYIKKYCVLFGLIACGVNSTLNAEFMEKYPDFIIFKESEKLPTIAMLSAHNGVMTTKSVNELTGAILGACKRLMVISEELKLSENEQQKVFNIFQQTLMIYSLIRKKISHHFAMNKEMSDIEALFNNEEKKQIKELFQQIIQELTAVHETIMHAAKKGTVPSIDSNRQILYVLPFMAQESIAIDQRSLCIDYMQCIINVTSPIETLLTIISTGIQDEKTRNTLFEPLIALLNKSGQIIQIVTERLTQYPLETTSLKTIFNDEELTKLIDLSQEFHKEVESVTQYMFTHVIEPMQK